MDMRALWYGTHAHGGSRCVAMGGVRELKGVLCVCELTARRYLQRDERSRCGIRRAARARRAEMWRRYARRARGEVAID